jgi:hypothetical protein
MWTEVERILFNEAYAKWNTLDNIHLIKMHVKTKSLRQVKQYFIEYERDNFNNFLYFVRSAQTQ